MADGALTYPKFRVRNEAKEQAFKDRVHATSSPTAMSAVETLEAAIWLLAAPMPAQALLMFHQAAEIALKGLLEEIHVILTARDLRYDLAKLAVKEKIQRHRLGKALQAFYDPDSYDPRKTCGFEEANCRVQEMIRLTSVGPKQIERMNDLRNRIAHRGGETDKELEYLDAILNTALPFLAEFYQKAYDDLHLEDLIHAPIARELDVARQCLEAAKADPSVPRNAGILQTFIWRYHLDRVAGRANLLFDAEGWAIDLSDREFELNRACRERADRRWDAVLGESADTPCVVCSALNCIVAIAPEPRTKDGQQYYDVVGLHCPCCGLFLDTDWKALARLHYGPITEARIGSEGWKNDVPR